MAKLLGVEKLEKKLKKNLSLDDVKLVVKTHGAQMQLGAQRRAPVKTGFLKRHIMLDLTSDGMTARVTSQAPYAAAQEYGTRYQSGTPHVGPAYRAQAILFEKDMRRLFQ